MVVRSCSADRLWTGPRRRKQMHRTPQWRRCSKPDTTGAGSVICDVRRNRAMWKEDPSYQISKFRFLVGTVLCALFAGPIVALWTGDWGFYQGFLGALAAGVTVWPGA